jgi:Tfp pilus assembly protein PilN
MQTVTTTGLDIAKSAFHGVDAANQVVIRRQLKRRQVVAFFQTLPACLVAKCYVLEIDEHSRSGPAITFSAPATNAK